MPKRVDVKALRSSMGMSTEDLAGRIGVHARTIERWESGKVAPSPLASSRLRELQHPDLPRRRSYEPSEMRAAMRSADDSADDFVRPAGGIVPSRRINNG